MKGLDPSRKLAATVASIVALCATAGVANAALSGNARGIALARRVLYAMSATRVAAYTQTGFVAVNAAQGKVSFFAWRWGEGGVPRGWARAVEHAVVVLDKRGRVLWWRDDLAPQQPACHTVLCGPIVPVEIIVSSRGQFYAFGSAAHHSCFAPLSGSTPYRFGARSYSVSGQVRAPARAGHTVKLAYRYVWHGPQRASETDIIAAATSRVLSGAVNVSGSATMPAFTFRFRYTYPTHTPAPPRITLCH